MNRAQLMARPQLLELQCLQQRGQTIPLESQIAGWRLVRMSLCRARTNSAAAGETPHSSSVEAVHCIYTPLVISHGGEDIVAQRIYIQQKVHPPIFLVTGSRTSRKSKRVVHVPAKIVHRGRIIILQNPSVCFLRDSSCRVIIRSQVSMLWSCPKVSVN